MIDLIVNDAKHEYVHEGLKPPCGSLSESVEYVIQSAEIMYPKWTSMQITFARPEVVDTPF